MVICPGIALYDLLEDHHINKPIKKMETPSKILLLTAMYGLPLCFVIFYSIIENIKQKRKVMNEKNIHWGAE